MLQRIERCDAGQQPQPDRLESHSLPPALVRRDIGLLGLRISEGVPHPFRGKRWFERSCTHLSPALVPVLRSLYRTWTVWSSLPALETILSRPRRAPDRGPGTPQCRAAWSETRG